MRRPLPGIAVTGTALAAVVGLTGTPAQALSWTITPVGGVSAAAIAPNGYDGTADVVLVNRRTGRVLLRCTASTIGGSVQSIYEGLVRITSFTFGGCSNWGLSFAASTGASPSNQILMSPTGIGGAQVGVKLDRVTITASAPGCTMTVGGPLSVGPLGTMTGVYDNTAGQLLLAGAGNLTARHPSGCFGFVADGDALAFHARYQLSPKLSITSS